MPRLELPHLSPDTLKQKVFNKEAILNEALSKTFHVVVTKDLKRGLADLEKMDRRSAKAASFIEASIRAYQHIIFHLEFQLKISPGSPLEIISSSYDKEIQFALIFNQLRALKSIATATEINNKYMKSGVLPHSTTQLEVLDDLFNDPLVVGNQTIRVRELTHLYDRHNSNMLILNASVTNFLTKRSKQYKENHKAVRGDFLCFLFEVALDVIKQNPKIIIDEISANPHVEIKPSEAQEFVNWCHSVISKSRIMLNGIYKELFNPKYSQSDDLQRLLFTSQIKRIKESNRYDLLPLLGIVQYGDLWKALRIVAEPKIAEVEDIKIEVDIQQLTEELLQEIDNEDIADKDAQISIFLNKTQVNKDLSNQTDVQSPELIIDHLAKVLASSPKSLILENDRNITNRSSELGIQLQRVQYKKVENRFEFTFIFSDNSITVFVDPKTRKIDWNRVLPFGVAENYEKAAIYELLATALPLLEAEAVQRNAKKTFISKPVQPPSQKGLPREKDTFDFSTPINTIQEEVDVNENRSPQETSTSTEIPYSVIVSNLDQVIHFIPDGLSKSYSDRLISKLEHINSLHLKKIHYLYKGNICFRYKLGLGMRAILVVSDQQKDGQLQLEIVLIDFRERVYETFKKKIGA